MHRGRIALGTCCNQHDARREKPECPYGLALRPASPSIEREPNDLPIFAAYTTIQSFVLEE